jgi:hypothetical protein
MVLRPQRSRLSLARTIVQFLQSRSSSYLASSFKKLLHNLSESLKYSEVNNSYCIGIGSMVGPGREREICLFLIGGSK